MCIRDRVYACMDLKQYFYQIPTSERTKQLIAINHASFATPYTWCVSPLGISSLPQVSSTILQKIIPKELKPFVATHIDDLALAADTEQELVTRLDILFNAFQKAGILVNAEKSCLITRTIDWLGVTITNGQTISMLEKRRKVFHEQTMPQSRAELSKFIGCVNFCSPFIFGLSSLTSILTPLLSTNNKFEFTTIHENAVREILCQIQNASPLHLIDKTKDIFIAIDSSYTGSGSVFYQIMGNKKHIVHFHSLTFSNVEKQGLGSLQKELLGIIRTLSLNKRIIHTHPNNVTLITDCQAILKLYLLAEATNNTKLTRWLNILETIVENKIKLLWRSNKDPDIMCADYLSRYMDNARHENICMKFSNKIPKVQECHLEDVHFQIPDQYKIHDQPITYKELVNLFHAQKPEIMQHINTCLLYTSPSPRDLSTSRMPSSA